MTPFAPPLPPYKKRAKRAARCARWRHLTHLAPASPPAPPSHLSKREARDVLDGAISRISRLFSRDRQEHLASANRPNLSRLICCRFACEQQIRTVSSPTRRTVRLSGKNRFQDHFAIYTCESIAACRAGLSKLLCCPLQRSSTIVQPCSMQYR